MTEATAPRGSIFGHVRARVLSGLVALIPLVLTFWVLRALLRFLAGLTLPLFGSVFADWPLLAREALAVLALVGALYVLGEVTALVVGRRLLNLGEKVLLRVPLARVIYGASKQVLESLQTTRHPQFRSVVAINFPSGGLQSIGFLTGTLAELDGEQLVTVFVPTTPNPTTGFLQIVPASRLTKLDITIEEAIRTIMSLGVLAPDGLGRALATDAGGLAL